MPREKNDELGRYETEVGGYFILTESQKAAIYILEDIMFRKNWTSQCRDDIAASIDQCALNIAIGKSTDWRGGNITSIAKNKRPRKS